LNRPHDLAIDKCPVKVCREHLPLAGRAELHVEETPGEFIALLNELTIELPNPAVTSCHDSRDVEDGVIAKGLKPLGSVEIEVLRFTSAPIDVVKIEMERRCGDRLAAL
jgi:hypothetical protein